MVSFLSIAALALLPAVLAQNLMVNTPSSLVECEPNLISWTGGSAPYFLSLVPAGQTSAPAIKQFPTQTGNSLTWDGDLASGTSLTIIVKDSTGTSAFSSPVTVMSGTSSSCVNTSVLESGSGGTVASTSGGSSSSGTASATASATAPTSGNSHSTTATGATTAAGASSGTPSATASAASSSSSTKPNGASSNRGNALVVAGVMGLIGAVLF